MAQHDPTAGPPSATITDLYQRFADRWTIAYESALAIWSAEQRSADGRGLRLICDPNPAALAGKLTAAEASQ
jgi:hypothetical protein